MPAEGHGIPDGGVHPPTVRVKGFQVKTPAEPAAAAPAGMTLPAPPHETPVAEHEDDSASGVVRLKGFQAGKAAETTPHEPPPRAFTTEKEQAAEAVEPMDVAAEEAPEPVHELPPEAPPEATPARQQPAAQEIPPQVPPAVRKRPYKPDPDQSRVVQRQWWKWYLAEKAGRCGPATAAQGQEQPQA